jgi:hypothetical protein
LLSTLSIHVDDRRSQQARECSRQRRRREEDRDPFPKLGTAVKD